MQQPKYVMKVAARLTRLTPFVIRSWEKRYGVVSPERTDTNRRLYSDADIEHLRLLRILTEKGHAIGSIAGLSVDDLRRMVEEEERRRKEERTGYFDDGSAATIREALLIHARALDARAIEDTLMRGSSRMSRRELLERVVVPFVEDLGRGWRDGSLRIAHEHVATAVIRTWLLNALSGGPIAENAPAAIVATPQGQVHELGALITANIAAMAGWDVTYLGADLPAEEIAASARDLEVSTVLLSIVFPPDDPRIHTELRSLARLLTKGTRIIAGGRAAAAYADTLTAIGAEYIESIEALWRTLSHAVASREPQM